MDIDVITLFGGVFTSPLAPEAGLIGKALAAGKACVTTRDLRAFGHGVHRQVDDTPYGGGAGMVLKVDVLVAAIEQARADAAGQGHVVLLTPQGRLLNQHRVRSLASRQRLILVCGRYEGFDERVREYVDEELSIGDYVMTGGEMAALVVIDAVVRQLPQVLGNCSSLDEESHGAGRLEYPHYTRPEVFRGMGVPQVLTSGHHARIQSWRRQQSLLRTIGCRPDLIEAAPLTSEELKLLSRT